jgi:CRP-like cAMP-binding protein
MPNALQFTQYIKASWTREELPAKHMLVKEGTLAKKLFFIETGCCRCWFHNDDGKEVTMNFGFEGSFVSSMETNISNEPSWYTVETLEPITAYSIPVSQFKELKATNSELQLFYCAYVENRLLHYQKLFVSRIKESPEKRYRELLEHHPEIIRRVPQHYIASFLGITSVSLSRIRNRK